LAATLVLVLSGCASDNFTVADSSPTTHHVSPFFNCHIITGYGTADQDESSGFTIQPNGIVAARKYGETEYSAAFAFKVSDGNAMRFRIRSEDTGVAATQGITFTFGKDASYVDIPGRERKPLAIKLSDDWEQMRILSCAGRVRVIAGCDTIMDEKSDLPLTDYIVFESVDSSICKIINMRSQWVE